MPLQIYNTLSRKKELFKPLKGRKVNFFICGITPYSYAHIGHAKTYIQFDLIVKYLRYLGYKVFYLQNITDIDDKIIQRAHEKNQNWKSLSSFYENSFYEDMQALGVNSITKYAQATAYIKQIQSQVQRLIDKKIAYKTLDGYYFDLTKFKDYGKLAKRTHQEAEDAVSRIDENLEKRNKGDFCLWKFSKKNEPSWNWKNTMGRPGWHIEDTAITEYFFGPQYDIHGGAVDLIFPHHEAEIAQMESISGKKPLVKYWLHTAFLNINKEKMSKSKKNFITIRETLEKYSGKVIRFFFVSNHYRTSINFSYSNLKQAQNTLDRLNNFVLNLKKNPKKDNLSLIKQTKEKFLKAMNNDFNTPQAFAIIFDFMKEVNKKGGGIKSYKLMLEFDKIFNVLTLKEKKLDSKIKSLILKREKFRNQKDYKSADKIRKELESLGIILEDTQTGVKWKPK